MDHTITDELFKLLEKRRQKTRATRHNNLVSNQVAYLLATEDIPGVPRAAYAVKSKWRDVVIKAVTGNLN